MHMYLSYMTGAENSVTKGLPKTLLAKNLAGTLRKPARRTPTRNHAPHAYQNHGVAKHPDGQARRNQNHACGKLAGRLRKPCG